MRKIVICVKKNFLYSPGSIIVVTGKLIVDSVMQKLIVSMFYSGACVCDLCSKDKVRIAKIEDNQLLHRVCAACARMIKDSRHYGAGLSSVE
jgi:hypothetical protein